MHLALFLFKVLSFSHRISYLDIFASKFRVDFRDLADEIVVVDSRHWSIQVIVLEIIDNLVCFNNRDSIELFLSLNHGQGLLVHIVE